MLLLQDNFLWRHVYSRVPSWVSSDGVWTAMDGVTLGEVVIVTVGAWWMCWLSIACDEVFSSTVQVTCFVFCVWSSCV